MFLRQKTWFRFGLSAYRYVLLTNFLYLGPLEYASIIEQYHTVLKEANEANMMLNTISDISPEVKAVWM